MGLRLRKSFKLFPGVRLNVSGGGLSASFGVPGATINVGKRGIRGTASIPGSGLSYSAVLAAPPKRGKQTRQLAPAPAPRIEPSSADGWPSPSSAGYVPAPAPTPSLPGGKQPYMASAGMREIGSKSVESLTSHSLVELRDMLIAARQQREEVEADLEQAANEQRKLKTELHKRSRSLFRLFYKKRIAALHDDVADVEDEIDRLEAWEESTHVDMDFETSDAAQRAYAALIRAFDALRSSAAIWDVTSDRDTNRIQERTNATRTVDRHPAKLAYAGNDLVRFSGRGLMFENVNGEDILIYPGMALMPRADGMFALIDLRELRVTYRPTRFVESERVPSDAYVESQTWAKVNKDGSPDKRFRDNYQIPICIYGQLAISSPSGVTEEYQVSNIAAAEAFAAAITQYQKALNG